ncbi:MAG: helix-turn-helix transcriptional regulator [Bacteroidales bacterium]|jgi:transcriptional regulator with XRE-family HTH domain|nr:helix-turn-helix transcriptional regulator [Bacteroidales bacterium]
MQNLFSIRLKQARIMQELSMKALCERTNNALTKQSISKYETGKMMPDSKSLIILSNALGVSLDYFFAHCMFQLIILSFVKSQY